MRAFAFALMILATGLASGQTVGLPAWRLRSLQSDAPNGARREDAAFRANGTTPAKRLSFRRIHIPEKELLVRIEQGEKYVAMDAAEFEARVKSLSRESQAPPESTAQIAAARYEAKLDGNMCLTGVGAWKIVKAGKEPTFLTLANLRLAISDPRWSGTTPPTGEAAKLGATESGEVALYVDRRGDIGFRWSLAGNPTSDSAWTYSLSFPKAASQRLQLDLPENLVPSMDGEIGHQEHAERSTGIGRWSFSMPPGGSGVLQIKERQSAVESKPLVIVRPKSTYEITPEGLQLLGEWRIDVHQEPITRLRIHLDSSLKLTSARVGESNVSWRQVEESDKAHQRFDLEFAEPLSGTNRLLRLVAAAPTVMGGDWTLPRMTAPSAIWQDGTMALVLPAPLSLVRLDLVDCRQTKREHLPIQGAGQAIGIQEFGPSARVQLQVAPRQQRVELRSATAVHLKADGATATYVGEFDSIEGERFRLEAEIAPDWIIDSIQSSPPGMVADWTRQRGEGGANKLIVHLAKSISPERSLRLVIEATSRRAGLGETIGMEDMRLLAFGDVASLRRLVMLNAESPLRLEFLQADDLVRLDPETLDAHDRALLTVPASGTLFVADDLPADIRVRLLEQRPRHTVVVHARAVVGDRELAESYQLRVEPESHDIDRLFIHFSAPRTGKLKWTVEDSPASPVASRRLSREERMTAGFGGDGETWEIQLDSPRRQPFVLAAQRTSEFSGTTPLSLLSVGDAASQRGEITVVLASEYIPDLKASRVKQITSEPAAGRETDAVLGTFEYDPAQESMANPEPALALVYQRDAGHRRRAWISQCLLESWFGRSANTQHRATLWIHNEGRRGFSIELPVSDPGATVQVDGAPATDVQINSNGQLIDIPLPSGRRFSLIQVAWIDEAEELGWIGWRSINWPAMDIPLLDKRIKVWLPAGYEGEFVAGARPLAPERSSWTSRLFGPFGRQEGQETFEPWLVRDWSTLVGGLDSRRSVNERTQRFLNEAPTAAKRTAARKDPDSSDVTFGELLYRCWYQADDDGVAPPVPLLIHWKSVEDAGLHAATAVETAEDPRAPQSMAELLRRHGLLLFVQPSGVVLAGKSWAAETFDASIAGSGDLVIDLPLTFEKRLSTPTGEPDAPFRFLPVEDWIGLPEETAPLWRGAATARTDEIGSAGWQAYSLELSDEDGQVTIAFFHRQTLYAVSLAVFVIVVGAVSRSTSARPLLRVTALGALVMVAFLAPAGLAPLGAACVWGLVVGHVLQRYASAGRELMPADRRASLQPATAAGAIALLVLICPVGADAQTGKAQVERSAVYDVLIPTQADEQIAPKRLYIPQPLYKSLLNAEYPQPRSDDYLITKAMYESFDKNAASRGSTDQNWRAVYKIEVFRPTHVSVPFDLEMAKVVPASATLDGQPLRFGWDNRHRAMTFTVEKAGSATVEFEFRPTWLKGVQSTATEIRIPPVPDSSLVLKNVPQPIQVHAVGLNQYDRNAQRHQVELGPLEAIVATDAERGQSEPAPAQFDAEESSWLKVRPGSAVLHVRYAIDVRRGEVRELHFALDRRLRLLPQANDSLALANIRQSAAEGDELRLQFGKPLTEHGVIDLMFVVDGVTGQSSFEYPQIHVSGAANRRRYAAFSADPALEITSSPGSELRPLSAAQLAAIWSDVETRPLAFELPPTPADWKLRVQPRQAKLSAEYQTILTANRNEATIYWHGALDISSGSKFQFRVAIPRELVIDAVEVRDAAGIRPSHWAVDDKGWLTVFLDSAVAGTIDLSLAGRLPLVPPVEGMIPLLKAEESASAKHSLIVMRSSNTAVAVDQPPAARKMSAGEAKAVMRRAAGSGVVEPSPTRGPYLAAAFHLDEASSVPMKLEKNQPHIEASQRMTLGRRNDVWQATLDLVLDIDGGVLDVVRIDVPAEWSESFRIEPDMPHAIGDAASNERRQLLIFPPQPLSGNARLRIEAPLKVPSQSRVSAPHARLAAADSVKAFVALPRDDGWQNLVWDLRGLMAENIPPELFGPMTSTGSMQTFAAAEPYEVRLRSMERTVDDFQIHLADISVNWRPDHRCYGVASFDINPAGKTSCRLALPSGYELIDLMVDGKPAPIAPSQTSRWQVRLSGGRLPQRLDVVFTGKWSGESSAPVVLEAPRLIGLPVERTLWTITGPASTETVTITDGGAPSRAALQEARYRSIHRLIKSAVNAGAAEMDHTREWYRVWAARLEAARRQLDRERALTSPAENNAPADDTISLVEREQQQLADQLGAANELQAPESGGLMDDAASAWRESQPAYADATIVMFDGPAHSLELRYAAVRRDGFSRRVAWVLATATALLVVAALLRYTTLLARFGRSPRAIAVVVGLFWWLFLWPSAAGWLIVLLAAAAPYLRQPADNLRRFASRWAAGPPLRRA